MTTYTFNGGSADLVTYQGTFHVDSGLVTDWSMTATSSWAPLPSYTFTNSTGQTATYCEGQCLFGSTDTVTIVKLTSSDGYQLRLTFDPGIYKEASMYQSVAGTGAKVTWGELSAVATPEPGTSLLLVAALLSLLIAKPLQHLMHQRRSPSRTHS